MIGRKHSHDVIDFFWERQKRLVPRQRNTIAELALDKCEEMFRCCDWDGFGRWYGIYRRERGMRSIHLPGM